MRFIRVEVNTKRLICEGIKKIIESQREEIERDKERLLKEDDDFVKDSILDNIYEKEYSIDIAQQVINEIIGTSQKE